MPDPFSLEPEREEPLGVLASTAAVVREARAVRIVPEAVERFAAAHQGAAPPSLPEDELHVTSLPYPQFCNYLLALEALNFCFWDSAPRWRVKYGEGDYDGYWALAAALHRGVVADGSPLADPHWLSRIQGFQLRHLLRGQGRPPPLMDARQVHLREVGRVLVERWQGSFANLVADCGGEAVALVNAIAREFSSFDDGGDWRGGRVRFLKRAQICVADLARLMPSGAGPPITGLEHLTAFADYKVPQVLRKAGVLEFAPPLAQKIARYRTLPAGGPEEVEIRAATVWACEWIVRALNRQGGAGGRHHTAAEVDHLLWRAGQGAAGLPPYHRTRTVYY